MKLLKMRAMPLKLLCLVSLTSLTSCVTVKDATVCSVAGVLSAGGICAHTLTSETKDLSFDEFVDFLEAHPERPDPTNPGQTLPARGAAICMSSEDFNNFKTSLEETCRMLGRRCSYEVKQMIENMKRMAK